MFLLAIFVGNLKVVIHTNMGFSLGVIVQCLSFLLYFVFEIVANSYLDY